MPLQFEVVTLAAQRLRDAGSALDAALASGRGVGASTLAEVHEAALELIWATGTRDLTSALAATLDPS